MALVRNSLGGSGGVRSQSPDRFFGADHLAPTGSPRHEEPLEAREAVQDLRLGSVQAQEIGIVGNSEASEVAYVLAQSQLAVDLWSGAA